MKSTSSVLASVGASASILADLESTIRKRSNGRVRNVRVSVRDQGLVLNGTTESYYAKQLAQHAVMESTKLPIAGNEIEVHESEFAHVQFDQ